MIYTNTFILSYIYGLYVYRVYIYSTQSTFSTGMLANLTIQTLDFSYKRFGWEHFDEQLTNCSCLLFA